MSRNDEPDQRAHSPQHVGAQPKSRCSGPAGSVQFKPEGCLASAPPAAADERQASAGRCDGDRVDLEAIIAAFDGLIYVCSRDYRIEFMNERLIARTGFDGTGQPCYRILHDREEICPWCVNQRVFAGETVRWELCSPKDRRWYQIVNTPIYEGGRIVAKQAMITDIHERVLAREALKEHSERLEEGIRRRTAELTLANEQLRQEIEGRKRVEEHVHLLTQQLIRAQEDERRRISRYLHDQVAQELSTLKILSETLRDQEPGLPEAVRQHMTRMSALLQRSIGAVRELAYDLRPPGLDQLGLVRTLRLYCQDFGRTTGVKVDFFSAGVEELRLDADLEIQIYRLLQEALHNVRKHAGAERVIVRLLASSPHLVLRIKDNGRGFALAERLPSLRSERRMGLQSMEERTHLVDGRMHITTRPGMGTSLYFEIPIKETSGDGT